MVVPPPAPAPAQVAPVRPLRTGVDLGSLSIPRLHERTPFFEGTTARVLARGAGHYRRTSLPSTSAGTVGIAAHRVTPVGARPYGPFRFVNLLRRNDAIVIRFRGVRYVYRVYRMRVVRPSAVGVLAPSRGFARLVLTTCTPPHQATFRLVVFARLATSSGA